MDYGRSSGICIAALVLSIVGFFINPCYIVVLLAIIFAIMGLCETPHPSNRGLAVAAIIIAPIAAVLQFIADCLLTLTGVGAFAWCC